MKFSHPQLLTISLRIKCADGIDPDDSKYDRYKAAQDLGGKPDYITDRASLQEDRDVNGNPILFVYSPSDAIKDYDLKLTPGGDEQRDTYWNIATLVLSDGIGGLISRGVGAVVGGVKGVFAKAGGGAVTEAVTNTALPAKYFPLNNGTLGETVSEFLYKGTFIDRYGGSEFSRFFSPVGTASSARALPPGTLSQPLRTFQVLKPFEVGKSTVAPAYGELGLGIQYRTPVTLEKLIDRGILREVPR